MSSRAICHSVVIVGSGLVGSWAAKVLCESGVDVLMLEAGSRQSIGHMSHEGVVSRRPIQQAHAAFAHMPSYFVDDIDNPYTCPKEKPYFWVRGRQVGGSRMLWRGYAHRLTFDSPSSSESTAQWPVTYEELAPHYDVIETYYGARGTAAGLPFLPDGRYGPPPSLTEAEKRVKALVANSYPEFFVTNMRGMSERVRTHLNWPLADAVATGRLCIKDNSIVSRLDAHSADKTVGRVICTDRDTGQEVSYRARVVMLAASTIESVRILLNSRIRGHPSGIGNNSGLLGRYLLSQTVVEMGGRVESPTGNKSHRLLVPHGILLANSGQDSRDMGGETFGANGWIGRGVRDASNTHYWSLRVSFQAESRMDNNVSLSETSYDAWRAPVPHICISESSGDRRLRIKVLDRIGQLVRDAGLSLDGCEVAARGQCSHPLGGARMGTRDSTSVLDPMNRVWEVPNLFVTDGCCFPAIGWQDPIATSLALTNRACTYIPVMLRQSNGA